MRKELWLIAGVAIGLGFLSLRQGAYGALSTKMDGKMPEWTMSDLAGRPVKSSDFKGRVVILNFWATWCPPCRAEIPDFIEFMKSHDTNRVIILGASVESDDPGVVRGFAERNQINYPVLLASPEIQEKFGSIGSIPTTFIVDTNGMFTTRNLGALSTKELKKLVGPLMP